MKKASQENNYGLVYVLTNTAMPGMVKIGMTQRAVLEQRMKELYGTGVPVPFDCAYACKVKASKTKMLEQALHAAFEPYRVNPKREFFNISPGQAIAILKIFDEGDVTVEVAQEITSDLTQEEQNAPNKLRAKRPKLNYGKLGIAPGATLVYTKNSAITVSVVDDSKVCYEGVVCSLTAATRKIMGLSAQAAIQPTPYWLVGNENLQEVYNRVFPIED